MASIGIQKAATLLLNLDPATAKQLLLGYPPDMVREIAMELARLDALGHRESEETQAIAEEFCNELSMANSGHMHVKSFLSDVLNDLDTSSNKENKNNVNKAIRDRDPFLNICSAKPEIVAQALADEHPQTIALVIAAVPPKLGTDVLARLDQKISSTVACRLAIPIEVTPRMKHKIAETVSKKIIEINSVPAANQGGGNSNEHLRKVALVLSGLDKEMRDVLVDEISSNDAQTGKTVQALMVTWEDIPRIYDRSLQEALRSVETSLLAKALCNADEKIAEKLKANISERAKQTLEEEMALMQDPQKKEILEAREEVVQPLRDANENGELRFIEE